MQQQYASCYTSILRAPTWALVQKVNLTCKYSLTIHFYAFWIAYMYSSLYVVGQNNYPTISTAAKVNTHSLSLGSNVDLIDIMTWKQPIHLLYKLLQLTASALKPDPAAIYLLIRLMLTLSEAIALISSVYYYTRWLHKESNLTQFTNAVQKKKRKRKLPTVGMVRTNTRSHSGAEGAEGLLEQLIKVWIRINSAILTPFTMGLCKETGKITTFGVCT